MLEVKRREPQSFSYEAEAYYYSRRIPPKAVPYLHLESHLRCWLDPEAVFSEKRVLDIGAGECAYTRLIADRFGPREIVACELFHERMLPAWRANRNPSLKAVAGDCFRLPFRSRSFDVVFASGVLSQLPNLKDAVLEIGRVLLPGGLFVGWDPNPFNPVILYRYLATPHSANQYLFWPHKVHSVFESSGFTVTTRFFYANLPWTRSRFLGTCIGIVASSKSPQRLPRQRKSRQITLSRGGAHRYNLLPISSSLLDSLTQLHLEAYPMALMTRLGRQFVRGSYDALFKDSKNVIGVVAKPEGSKQIAAYCVGLLNGDRATRYFWGTTPGLTAFMIFLKVLVSPHLWKTAFLQIWGWGLSFLHRWLDGDHRSRREAGVAMLMDIACAADHRRRGLARHLLQEWEDEMVRRGASAAKLFVRASNTAAIKLYEQMGWKITRPMSNIQQPGYLMMKDLRSKVSKPVEGSFSQVGH